MKYLIVSIALLPAWTFRHPAHPLKQLKSTYPHIRSFQVSWDSTRNWKIYKLTKFKQVFEVPVDSLPYMPSTRLSDDTMHLLLSGSTRLGVNSPAWMGCYLASFETPAGKPQKVVVSLYGGFFFSPTDHTYYQVGTDIQKEWLEYLSQCYGNIPQTN